MSEKKPSPHQIPALFWERVGTTESNSGEECGNPNISRAMVPGGWLVLNVGFYPDPLHVWGLDKKAIRDRIYEAAAFEGVEDSMEALEEWVRDKYPNASMKPRRLISDVGSRIRSLKESSEDDTGDGGRDPLLETGK